MPSVALCLSLPVAVTLTGALADRAPVPRAAKHALALAFLLGGPFVLWQILPEEKLLRALLLILAIFNLMGNVVAIEWRIRKGSDTLASYLFDVLTVGSSRIVPELATPGASVPGRAARGLACAGLATAVTLLLERVPPDSLPLLVWTYFKLHVVGLGAQAVSDLLWAASFGSFVPIMRLPLLSTSFLDFWGRRYNLWVHGALLWMARDLLGLRRRPWLLLIVAFLVSGALHEVLSVLLLGELHGWWMGFRVAQIVLTFLSVKLTRLTRGTRAGPAIGLLFVHAGMTVSAPLFFAVVDRVWNAFGVATPAPW